MGGIWMAGPSVAGSGRAVSSRGFYVFPPMTLQYRARWERERGTWKLYHCCTEGQQSALRIQQCNAPIGPNSQAPTPPFPGELLPPPPFFHLLYLCILRVFTCLSWFSRRAALRGSTPPTRDVFFFFTPRLV